MMTPGLVPYSATKSAIRMFTQGLSREVGDRGITVNAIAPGFTLTKASYSLIEDAATYGIERAAIKRPCQPEDIVGAALFLADPASDYITGQTLVVDGGALTIPIAAGSGES
jgi:NAD(P)-dependent dehydrogenase (short-subunit alcohol dehydrogenase family)